MNSLSAVETTWLPTQPEYIIEIFLNVTAPNKINFALTNGLDDSNYKDAHNLVVSWIIPKKDITCSIAYFNYTLTVSGLVNEIPTAVEIICSTFKHGQIVVIFVSLILRVNYCQIVNTSYKYICFEAIFRTQI